MHAVRQEFVQSKDGQWYRRGEEPEVNEDEGEEKDAL
jgi:hypothetical protein